MRLIDDSFLRVRDQKSHVWYLAINGISKHEGLSTIRDASSWIFMSGGCKCKRICFFISSMQIPTWGFSGTQRSLLILCGISSVNLSFLKFLLCQRFPWPIILYKSSGHPMCSKQTWTYFKCLNASGTVWTMFSGPIQVLTCFKACRDVRNNAWYWQEENGICLHPILLWHPVCVTAVATHVASPQFPSERNER